MNPQAVILLTYLFIFSFGFLIGKFLRTNIELRNIVEIIVGFTSSFILLWAMLYVLRDISLYDLHRSVIKSTLGLYYILIFGLYILIYMLGIWLGNLSEEKNILSFR